MLVSPAIHMESNHQQQQEPTHPKERSGTSFSMLLIKIAKRKLVFFHRKNRNPKYKNNKKDKYSVPEVHLRVHSNSTDTTNKAPTIPHTSKELCHYPS